MCVYVPPWTHLCVPILYQVRQGLKKFSNWPTYPQLYSKGELIGGLDIARVICLSKLAHLLIRYDLVLTQYDLVLTWYDLCLIHFCYQELKESGELLSSLGLSEWCGWCALIRYLVCWSFCLYCSCYCRRYGLCFSWVAINIHWDHRCETQQVYWRVGTGHVLCGMRARVGTGEMWDTASILEGGYWGDVRHSKYTGEWVLGMCCVGWELGFFSPLSHVVSTQLSLEILKSDMIHSSLELLPLVGGLLKSGTFLSHTSLEVLKSMTCLL